MGFFGDEKREKRQLDRIEAKENALLAEEDMILELSHQILDHLKPKLSYIKLAIGGKMPIGPQTLNVGDKKTLSVLGFDQFGQPFSIDFTQNPVTFTDDNEAVLQDTPGSTVTDPVTALSAGTANVTATCAGFGDTETYTVIDPPRLSSIKISLD